MTTFPIHHERMSEPALPRTGCFSDTVKGGKRAIMPEYNIFFAFIIGGMLPGITTVTAIALFVPFTCVMSPATALCTHGACYTGATYGGTSASLLINTPGQSASFVTTLDDSHDTEGKDGRSPLLCASGLLGRRTFRRVHAPFLLSAALQPRPEIRQGIPLLDGYSGPHPDLGHVSRPCRPQPGGRTHRPRPEYRGTGSRGRFRVSPSATFPRCRASTWSFS